ncbi:MAG TPA: glycerol kinase GlpK [Chthoniobacterales bacterium]
MSKFILAFDQGTTSSRAIVFDQDGNIKSVAQKEFTQIFPQPGFVEHDPKEIWSSQSGVAIEALTRAGLGANQVAAIGITNQRETTIIWDRKTGEPVYNAIVWQDRRTSGMCDRIKANGHAKTFLDKTGLFVDPYFAGTKVKWILDNVDGVRKRAERGELAFGTVDSWLVWNLTEGQVHVTDASNAARTLLYNIHENRWDEDLLKILDIPASLLPRAGLSSEVYGETLGKSFLPRIPIAGMAGDQNAALFGQTCFQPGMAKNTYGTGCFLLMNTGETAVPSKNNMLTTIGWRIRNRTEYAFEGSIFIGGAVVQWLRDGLHIIETSPDVEDLAASVPDSAGVYFVPAFVGLGAPHWDPYARGTIIGITRGTTKAHIARAALEAIALQSYDVLHAMELDAGTPLKELRVDGGACANNLLMQIQADVLGVPVVRPKVTETTALGAAYLAGLAVGYWKSRAEIESQWSIDRTFEPQGKPDQIEKLRAGWEKAVKRASRWEEAEA